MNGRLHRWPPKFSSFFSIFYLLSQKTFCMKYILVGALSASMVGEVLRSIYNCKMVLVKSTRLYKYAVYIHTLID